MDVFELAKIIKQNAASKGWYEGYEPDLDHIMKESDELFEAAYDVRIPKEEVENEAWDVIFMTLSFLSRYGYDLHAGFERTLKKILDRE